MARYSRVASLIIRICEENTSRSEEIDNAVYAAVGSDESGIYDFVNFLTVSQFCEFPLRFDDSTWTRFA